MLIGLYVKISSDTNVKKRHEQKEFFKLEGCIRRCRNCPLHRSQTHAVAGEWPVS
jgi:uracil-DNA glycosylase